jgi:hypothetical protein
VITAVLLSVLGLVLVVVLVLMIRSPSRKSIGEAPAPPTLPSAGKTDLLTARKGDVISIHAAAEDFSDLDFTVDRRSAYQHGHRRWIDLSGDFRDRRVHLEVEPGLDHDLVGFLDGRRMTLADIRSTEEQLAEMDAKQNPMFYLDFDHKRWYYESSRELGYFADEQGQAEGLYRWVFKEADGLRLLCIEKREGEPFEVRMAQRLNPGDINVYRAA